MVDGTGSGFDTWLRDRGTPLTLSGAPSRGPGVTARGTELISWLLDCGIRVNELGGAATGSLVPVDPEIDMCPDGSMMRGEAGRIGPLAIPTAPPPAAP
jgi:hypothetical protein